MIDAVRVDDLDLSVEIGSLRLRNPVIAASGCYNRGVEFGRIMDVAAYGAVTLKSITRAPRLGNDMPRLLSTPCCPVSLVATSDRERPATRCHLPHQISVLGPVEILEAA